MTLTIGKRITFGFAIVLLFTAVLGGLAYWQIGSIQRETATLSTETIAGLYDAGQIDKITAQNFSRVARHILAKTPEHKTKLEILIAENRTKLSTIIKEFEEGPLSTETRRLFTEVGSARTTYVALCNEAIELSRTGKTDEAAELMDSKLEAAFDILDAVASLAIASIPVPPDNGHWKTRIKELCFGIRGMALQQPNVFRVAMTRHIPPEKAQPHIAAALSAFADAGLPPAAQAVAYQIVRFYVRAHCLWEIDVLGSHRAGDFTEIMHGAVDYSSTAAPTKLVFAPDPDRQFEAGLDLILRGLQVTRDR